MNSDLISVDDTRHIKAGFGPPVGHCCFSRLKSLDKTKENLILNTENI